MWFAYIDESKDHNKFYIYTALITNGERWPAVFEKIKELRNELKRDHGIFVSEELHAWKFAAGKGRIADRPIYKEERAEIYRKVMKFIGTSSTFAIASSCNTNEQYAFERLLNRINRTAVAKDENVLLFFDQGAEVEITKRIRKLRVHNPIPSNRGTWQSSGKTTKNIPLSNIIEDPIFKDSENSYFIQLADFCAYALLRMERPIPSRTELGYHTMYEELLDICRPFLNPSDPKKMGIIR